MMVSRLDDSNASCSGKIGTRFYADVSERVKKMIGLNRLDGKSAPPKVAAEGLISNSSSFR